MLLSDISVKRPVFATMMLAALVVFGIISYFVVGIDIYPRVEWPYVSVRAFLEGASAEEMETEVTKRMEEAINTVSSIKKLRSVTREENAFVLVEFELEKDPDVGAQEVRDRLAVTLNDMPEELEPLVIEKVDPDASPIMSLVVSSPRPLREVTEDFVDDIIEPRLERLKGVGQVKRVGGAHRQINAWVLMDKLYAYDLSAQKVFEALQRNHLEVPGGRVTSKKLEYVLRTMGEYPVPALMNTMVVENRPEGPIYFSELGYVEDGVEEQRTLSRLNLTHAVGMLIRKQSGTNTVEVIKGVKEQLGKLKEELPKDIDIQIVQDQAVFIQRSVDEAIESIWIAAMLTTVVIFIFLISPRATFIIAVSLPASLIATFTFFRVMGFTLNYMTLLALSIAVGLVVDDSIIVLECIFRHLEQGESPMEAARRGTNEIGMAATVSTLSIVAVFVPVAFMKGITGRYFFSFALTVAFTVMTSLFVAFTAIPMLSSRFLYLRKKHNALFRAMERFLVLLESTYRALLTFWLRNRLLVIGLALFVFVSGCFVASNLGAEFVPAEDENEFRILVETPKGSSMDQSSALFREVEEKISQLPHVRKVYATIGGGVSPHITEGQVYVKLDNKTERPLSQMDIMAMAREILAKMPAVKATVEEVPWEGGSEMGEVSAPIQFILKGPDLSVLKDYSERIMAEMSKVDGIVDVDSNYEKGQPELRIEVDRDKASELGIDMETISSTMRYLVGGEVATYFKEGDDRYDVRLRLVSSDRASPQRILDMPVIDKTGKLNTLINFAQLVKKGGPTEINRIDREREVTIFANLKKGYPLSEANKEIKNIVDKVDLPPGYLTDFSGHTEWMDEAFRELLFALVLSIIIIYMVLASQFESFSQPLVIMMSLPLSAVGAFGALYLGNMTISLFSLIGIVILMGLVTKNAILLVDYTNLLRSEGTPRDEALIRAGGVRLRPIIMTSITTIMGMVPVALSMAEGAEVRAPMGYAVIGGMTSSTLLTLLVVPVVYSLMDDFFQFLNRSLARS